MLTRLCELARADERVLGFGLGGSINKLTADDFADIDLFFLVGENRLQEFIHDLPHIAAQLGQVVFDFDKHAAPGPHAYYLHLYKALYPDMTCCDFHVNTPASLTPHPFRKYTHVLVDKTGYYTRFTEEQTRASLQFDPDREFRCAARRFWFDAEKLYVALQRHDLWQAQHYLHELRLALFRMARLNHAMLSWPDYPCRDFELEFGRSVAESLAPSLAGYSARQVWAAYRFCCHCFQDGAHLYAIDHSCDWYLAAEQGVSRIVQRWLNLSHAAIAEHMTGKGKPAVILETDNDCE